MKKIITKLILLVSMPVLANTQHDVPVKGFARSFISGSEIKDATITILETGQRIKTNAQGQFGPFYYPIGKPLTLFLEKTGYHPTQSATVFVPSKGLINDDAQMTLQVPSRIAYYFLTQVIGANENPNSCHVATTITSFHKTLDDDRQGETGATLRLNGHPISGTFYFNIFQDGWLKDKTNPFTKNLTKTTEDGGALIFNLEPREKLYVLSANKAGVVFNQVHFLCRRGVFINLSPPFGPSIIKVKR